MVSQLIKKKNRILQIQIRRRATMFLHNQSRFAAELQGDVVPRNTTVLPADSCAVSGMQERSALHVSR